MSSILLQINDAIAFITLNRPDKMNAFNREMALQLQAILKQCNQDKSVRAICITGNGKAFCAGQDISELTQSDAPSFEHILSEHYNPIITLLRTIQKPIVAAVNGVAAGAGANIALACDIVIAANTASFIQAFSKIGLIPDSGGTFFLPRLIGFQKATAIMMLGDKISATEAEKMGMIYKVIEANDFENETKKLVTTLATLPTLALAYTKQALNASLQHNFAEQLQLEDTLQYKAAQTKDYAEGIAAFIEKRRPSFVGA